MRLAEALIDRASLQTKFNALQARIVENVTVQEGESPAEKPDELIYEALSVITRLRTLIQNINRTNSRTVFEGDVTLSDAIAWRDSLKLEHQLYEKVASSATATGMRFSRNEIKQVSIVDVSAYRKKADAIAAKYRALDTKIQEFNWKTDLIED